MVANQFPNKERTKWIMILFYNNQYIPKTLNHNECYPFSTFPILFYQNTFLWLILVLRCKIDTAIKIGRSVRCPWCLKKHLFCNSIGEHIFRPGDRCSFSHNVTMSNCKRIINWQEYSLIDPYTISVCTAQNPIRFTPLLASLPFKLLCLFPIQ